MPEVRVADQNIQVESGGNLLDSLLAAGIAVPFSCRAGRCHACLVRCVQGQPADAQPQALSAAQQTQGWRLACQCRVVEDLQVEAFDPARDGVPARVEQLQWLRSDVLRVRLQPARPLRYQPGQHLLLWAAPAVARPYSMASVPALEPWLEFHMDCAQPGAFCDLARQLQVGDTLRLGEVQGGALHYQPEWQARPLLLIASGTGLAPLWSLLREALREEHRGPIRLLHLARSAQQHYLADALQVLAQSHSNLQVELLTADALEQGLAQLRLVPRQTLALLCGAPERVAGFVRGLYLAGVPRNQILTEHFVSRAGV
jgi:NAD(P)H-flavin reductase/ferredoxin